MSNNLPTHQSIKVSRLTAVQLCPDRFKEVFANMDPIILEMTEIELEDSFKRTPMDFALRKRLWELIENTQVTGAKFTIDEWVRGHVDTSYVYQKMIHNPFRMAWIFTPLGTHQERYEELFHVLFNKFRKKIKEMDLNDENFSASVKLLENISNRVLGPLPRNINLKAAHMHMNNPAARPVAADVDVDKRLEELEKMKDITPAIVDVDPE